MAKLIPTGIFKALGIVWKNLVRRNIVIEYPWEKYPMPERARWAVKVKSNEDGSTKCTGCLICEKACPPMAINIQITTDPETRDKHIDHWQYDRAGCMMCGLCVEACPFDALMQERDIELAHAAKDLKIIDLVTDEPAFKKKREAAPKPAPKPAAQEEKPEAKPAAQEEKPAAQPAEGGAADESLA